MKYNRIYLGTVAWRAATAACLRLKTDCVFRDDTHGNAIFGRLVKIDALRMIAANFIFGDMNDSMSFYDWKLNAFKSADHPILR